jgi:hypothetical protein
MPRTGRLDTPGLLNHILIIGIDRRRIFSDDKDRQNFVESVPTLFHMETAYITGRARQKENVRARDLVCYLSAIELGISLANVTK